jgi:hypothetical protein
MLDLLETIAGAVVLVAYLGVAVVLPSAVVIAFVFFIGTLLRLLIDPAVAALPEAVRAQPVLAAVGRRVRGLVIWAVGSALFLALVGTSSVGFGPDVIPAGFAQMLVTLTAIQDIVATAFTGRVLNDMLLELQPTATEHPIVSLRLLQTLVAVHLYNTLQPGVTSLAFRWTFAAFATAVVAIYVVIEPLRAVRKRVSLLIAPQQREAVISEESLERQAELIAQALAKATPAVPVAAPSAPVSVWARPGLARAPAAPSTAPPAPGAIPSTGRVAVVTWDGELAAELVRQLDAAGFAPLVMRSVAEAFASRVWPAIVFIDARHLEWLSPERLPLLVRARLVAVTRDDLRVPRGWQLDTHALEGGSDALLELLRRRDARRRAGSRDSGA